MRFLGWIVSLPVLLVLIAFALENRQSVTLDFFLLDFQIAMPLSLLALGLLFVGFALGLLTSWLGTLSLKLALRRQRKETQALAEELAKRPPLPEEPRKRFSLPFFSRSGDAR